MGLAMGPAMESAMAQTTARVHLQEAFKIRVAILPEIWKSWGNC